MTIFSDAFSRPTPVLLSSFRGSLLHPSTAFDSNLFDSSFLGGFFSIQHNEFGTGLYFVLGKNVNMDAGFFDMSRPHFAMRETFREVTLL